MNEWPLPGELPPTTALSPVADVEPYPFWEYKDIAFFVVMLLVAVVVASVLAAAVAIVFPSPVLLLLLAQFLVYGAGLLSLWAIVSRRYGRPLWHSLRWGGYGGSMWQWAVAGVVTAVAAGLLGALLGTPEIDETPMQEILSSRLGLAAVGVLAVTIGPVIEELVFRGFLLPLLARSVGGVAAVLITAVLFSLPHLRQYGGAWQAFVQVGFAGVCFGAARLYTGSTGVAGAMHAVYNLTTFCALLAQIGVRNLPW